MRSPTARITKVVAASALCVAATASPALAQVPGYTLNLSAPPAATVGQPAVMQATGSNPPGDFFSSYLGVHAIPTSVLSTCPTGYLEAHQIADSTYAQGGEAVAISQRENVDAAGNFSMPVVFTPRVAGQFLICAYSEDAATTTLALTSRTINVQAPGGGGTPGGGAPGVPPTGGGGTTTPALSPGLSHSFKAFRGFTRFGAMKLRGVPSGSKVVGTCKHRRKKCSGKARRAFTKRNASGTVSLTRFTGLKLKPGSVITIKVTKPGTVGAVNVITIRKGKAPRFVTR